VVSGWIAVLRLFRDIGWDKLGGFNRIAVEMIDRGRA